MMRTRRGLRIIEGRWQEILEYFDRARISQPGHEEGRPCLRTARLELKTEEDEEIVIRPAEDELRNELVVDIRLAEDIHDGENDHSD